MFESFFLRGQSTSIRSIEREADECFPTKSWPSGILPRPRSLRPSSSALYCMQACCTMHNIHTVQCTTSQDTRLHHTTLYAGTSAAAENHQVAAGWAPHNHTVRIPSQAAWLTFTHLQRSAADHSFRHSLSLGLFTFGGFSSLWHRYGTLLHGTAAPSTLSFC